ncbi:MAG: hypothetical protein WC211_10450 [Dehalococcoidia bacterium]
MNSELMRLQDPTALLVLRVSIEHGATLPLRAYIRETSDVSRGFERSSTVTEVEVAVRSVRTWLEALIAADAARTDQPDATHDDSDGSATTEA